MAERATTGPLMVEAWPEDAHDREGSLRFESASPSLLHEVLLRGLRPATRYRYEVRGPDVEPVEGRFITAPEGVGFVPFRFVVYGDTRSREAPHRAVVAAAAREGADWAIHTGDLIDDGRDETQWDRFFEIERPLLASTPLLPVIGNHEIARPGSSGINLYLRYMRCAPHAPSPSPELDYAFSWGNVHLVLVNAYDDFTDDATARWLDERLAAARRAADEADGWVLFVTHWGPRSSGPHGDNRPFRMANIEAMLRRHRVDLSIAGHDHAYERGDDRGLRYLVSGGGGAPLYRRRSEREHTRFFASEHHYVRVDVERSRLVFTALRLDGTELERCGLRRDGWDCDRMPHRPPASARSTGSLTEAPSDAVAAIQRSCRCHVGVGAVRSERAEIARWCVALACARLRRRRAEYGRTAKSVCTVLRR